MTPAPVYFDHEVDKIIAGIMAKLPAGSSCSSRILNGARTVTIEVRLPDGGKSKVFEYGLIGYGGTVGGRSRIGRPGDPLTEVTAKGILKWAKE
jgi:hypothetical protein